ncbi:acetyl-CoA carboxylase biotin carboxyl carrier protein subunit [Seonamhaeicola algicola]|uniref:Acetyl-CoA carboxylase biotin carboxyl carrier protein subunit n=1 Tax=Seonamhaeicola algicola TaxID=1719036 RepID=A0A5C7B1U3_9FLAO|nr:acetyl-CoA carboxylase biotin carboxyl carrier protein subunit [Seonamhaeicola algicola]TXE11832.1 acetyl-CoA carboxylase biotin carboxyl carrier protein subunit [Seonamhaeicola algicola]
MTKTFKTKVNDTFDFEITTSQASSLDAIQVSNATYHILQNNTSYNATIEKTDFNKRFYSVKINNNTYNVSIKNDLDTLVKSMGFSIGGTKHINAIKAPMPGLILEINVEKGTKVNENDTLLILEAMKMENVITAPRDGIIKSVSVKKGDAVEKNQLLIEFDA